MRRQREMRHQRAKRPAAGVGSGGGPAADDGVGVAVRPQTAGILWLEEIDKTGLAAAGGKGASLGEMARAGFPVPPGFVVTADVFRQFFQAAGLHQAVEARLKSLDADTDSHRSLDAVARRIKRAIMAAPMPPEVAEAILESYHAMGAGLVAVRSSATAEDLPEASFAGQQETFLNVEGDTALVTAVQECWASLFEPRAIVYRQEQGFDHMKVLIAVVVQRMVQSDVSGVLFTVEPLSNDGTRMAIEAIYGLGEAIVSGAVTPDLYIVDKGSHRVVEEKVAQQPWKLVRNPDYDPAMGESPNVQVDVPLEERGRRKLSPEFLLELARLGRRIEYHYGHPQDVEWALEGDKLFIVQSRPITTLGGARDALKRVNAKVLVTGSGASPGVESGPVRVVRDLRELHRVQPGDVLVTEMTTPDFVPAMKRAAAIVTDRGGRTCHAAIVSRELGIACVVGAEGATTVLSEDTWVTVDGALGLVYEGKLELTRKEAGPRRRIRTATRVYVNLADPELADVIAQRQADGVGLLRAEFIIAHIGEHPRHMLETGRGEEWSGKLSEGIEAFARAFAPRPVVYRTSDFKTNEYRNLRGGELYEGEEENPMIGYRGASRYLRERELFHLEAQAILGVWRRYPNLHVMIPFVRTPKEMAQVKETLAEEGLSQDQGLKLWMMAEIPSNVILLDQFLDLGVDGISIGSNDLTQLVLGIDRDNAKFHEAFDERDPAVLWCLERIIRRCNERGVTVSICGQAPSFYPDLTERLVDWGITSVSVSPDMIDRTRELVARGEKKLGRLPPQEEDEEE